MYIKLLKMAKTTNIEGIFPFFFIYLVKLLVRNFTTYKHQFVKTTCIQCSELTKSKKYSLA